MNNVPNFDDLPITDPMFVRFSGLWHASIRAVRALAHETFPERQPRHIVVTRLLGQYAKNKEVAVMCRAKGNIRRAKQYEDICDRIYEQLPLWARW